MYRFSRSVVSRLLVAAFCVSLCSFGSLLLAQTPRAQASVRQVKVLGSKDAVEIEIEASDGIIPETRVLTGPDRLVVDFPNAVPGSQLRSQSVNLGEVKDVRVGLFQSKPAITRVVLDLKTAQSYQVFPNGRTVMIKVIKAPARDASAGVNDVAPRSAMRPGLVSAMYTTAAGVVTGAAPAKPLDVSFRDGMLVVKANKATLSEVLFAIQQRTGADIAIPAGAEQERVVADLGPGPAREVLAHLLNGSKFNFLILNSANDPRRLDRVILSPRVEGVPMAVTPTPSHDEDVDALPTTPVSPPAQPDPVPGQAAPVPPRPQPEIPPQPPENPQQ